MHIYVHSSGGTADTTAVLFNTWTTGPNNPIVIEAYPGDEAGLSWNNSIYRLSVSNSIALNLGEEYVYLLNFQIEVPAVNADGQDPISIGSSVGIGASNEFRLFGLLIRGAGNISYYQRAVNFADSDIVAYMGKCFGYNFSTKASSSNRVIAFGGTTLKISNCGFIGGYYGLYRYAGAIDAKNCYFGGSATADYYPNSGTLNMTTCASEDATGSAGLQGVLIDADTFVNVGAGTEDFHQAADGLSPLYHAGTDTSGDASPMNFDTDIDGDDYYDTGGLRSIGPDELVSAGPTVATNVVCMCGVI
jgi:hypothetical protein